MAAVSEQPRKNAAQELEEDADAPAGWQRYGCIDFCGITADFGGLPVEQSPLTRW